MMTSFNAAATNMTIERPVFSGTAAIVPMPIRTAAEELSLLQDETTWAVMRLRSFRQSLSANPKADLKVAFDHIDHALGHSRALRAQATGAKKSDQSLLHLSMQYFQSVLSDIPQISFLDNRMIDIYHDIKEELGETRRLLEV